MVALPAAGNAAYGSLLDANMERNSLENISVRLNSEPAFWDASIRKVGMSSSAPRDAGRMKETTGRVKRSGAQLRKRWLKLHTSGGMP